MTPIRRALLSVSDKTGLPALAKALAERGVLLLSTGGTAKLLRDLGLPVMEVSDHTGFPEMMDGRLKTLHPKIHGGILGRRGVDEVVMATHDIPPIDLVVVNLYPFESTVAHPDCDLATAVENIDIGGPALLRAAAKNHAAVTVLVDAGDYSRVLDEMAAHEGAVSEALRFDLAVKAFEHTARYDGAIANYFGTRVPGGEPGFPRTLSTQVRRVQAMRYGENPHQRAAFYVKRHESRRIDRQLRGRCSRQGDPGSSHFFISLEDDLMRLFGSDRIVKLMERMGLEEGEELKHGLLNRSIQQAQKRVEGHNFQQRKRTLEYDDVMNKQREVIYGFRNEIINSDDVRDRLMDTIEEVVILKVEEFTSAETDMSEWRVRSLADWVNLNFPLG
ncbi:MAG: hypothetical protein WCP34_00415, partial [Pseudomonadota bacterium]